MQTSIPFIQYLSKLSPRTDLSLVFYFLFCCSFRCRHTKLPTIDNLHKETNQRKCSLTLVRFQRIPCAAQKKPGAVKLAEFMPFRVLKQSESTPLYDSAYLSRYSGFFYAARLREMAFPSCLQSFSPSFCDVNLVSFTEH